MFSRWTALPGEEVCRRMGADSKRGLAAKEVERRRRQWGDNVLAATRGPSLPALFLNQFRDFMVLVLLAATLFSALLGEFTDALVILIIVLLNAVLGLVQEYRAERSMDALKKLAAPRAAVLRDGQIKVIPAAEIVPGDLLFLEAGDRVGADLRLITARSLSLNEAALTGESVAVLKQSAPLGVPVASPGDALNIAFSGTEVVNGRGCGVVIATAMQTEIGRIAHLIEHTGQNITPLQQRLARLGRVLVALCVCVCCAVTLLGVLRGEPLYNMFMAGVSLAVAAIPEGLPAIVTVALALGVQRMIRRRAIVRRLPAVETLGSASVICSDKTGTLTLNRMSMSQVFAGSRLYKVEKGSFHARKRSGWEQVHPSRESVLQHALFIAVGCNNAYRQGNSYHGDPTEAALLKAADEAGFRIMQGRREKEYPFSSERKMMSVVWREKGGRRLLLKGAPEIVLSRCRFYMDGERARPITPPVRKKLAEEVDRMASLGLRALAVACRDLTAENFSPAAEQLENDLVWSGLLGLEDPPRPEVLPAIRLCRQAGIRVIMITGDHRNTAEAVARRLEILQRGGIVLTGRDLSTIDDEKLQKLMGDVQVFARVSPEHKLRIVRALKHRGEVVAMTGDGINDAPAVKEADIGIAMGIMGTDVTREAADLVLADDNFSTIVAAVEEGRNIYSNIRKFIRFLLGCNIGEVLTMVLAILCGLPLPFRPIQILWINLATDGLPALALGIEPPEEALMRKPPRKRDEEVFSGGLWGKIATRGVLIAVVTVAMFALVLTTGGDLARAQTMAFAALITAQLVYVFDCRGEASRSGKKPRPSNRFLNAAVASSCLLMIAVIYSPFLSSLFYTVCLGAGDWLVIAIAGFLPAIFDYGIGMINQSLARKWTKRVNFVKFP